ncbi:MAG: TIR domain-containing protein [Methanobacterium sp.]|uniref:TIR domain-containing protein n=1 Tax=Methanobacterium sp. TaxID=2164 RepID=UPI003D65AAD6|nr:TIR domain-containing protein [Methanobacterium sp.]
MFESELKVHKLFISHIGENEKEYDLINEKLSSAHEFEYKNFSILKKDKLEEKELQKQIESANVVIILSGLYNNYNNIIKNQIDISMKLNKPIIVIRPYGMEDVPPELEEIAAEVIGWNAPCVIDAIEENYLE